MSRDRALLIDADEVFRQLLEESLAPHGIAVSALSDPELLGNDPELSESAAVVLIGVDLPDKAGFRHFTQVRSLASRVPTVLVTATLSAEELSLHAKLRLHADLYLDKRLLTQEILADALAPLVPDLIPPAAQTFPSALSGSSVGLDADERTRWLVREVSSDELDALTEAIAEGDDEEGALTPARFARLTAQLEQLRRELDDSRRSAQSSPFSEDYRSLSEENRQQQAELTHLRVEIGHRDAQIADLERHVDGLERRCTAALGTRDEALGACEGLTRRAEESEQQALRLERTLQQKTETHAAEIAELQRQQRSLAEQAREGHERTQVEIQSLRDREARLREAHASAQAALRSERARELESLREAGTRQQQELEERAKARVAEAVRRGREEMESRLADVQRLHGRELEGQRSALLEEAEALRQAHVEALAKRDREAVQASAAAVEAARAELLTRLANQERSHEKAMAALREGHARAAGERERSHQTELESRERALAAARSEYERNQAESARTHEDALALQRREHETARQALEAEAARALAAAEQAAREQLESALHQAKAEAESRLEETLRTHAAEREALAAESRERGDVLEALREGERTGYERDLAEQRSAREQQLAEQRATHERALVEQREAHARELTAQREALERELSEQRAAAVLEERRAGDVRLEQAQREHTQALDEVERGHAGEIASLREAHTATMAIGQQDAEAAELRFRTELEQTRGEQEGLQAHLELARADAERADHELTKARADLVERDALLQIRDLELSNAREILVSLQAVLGDLQRAIDALTGEPGVADGTASLLRSLVATLDEALERDDPDPPSTR